MRRSLELSTSQPPRAVLRSFTEPNYETHTSGEPPQPTQNSSLPQEEGVYKSHLYAVQVFARNAHGATDEAKVKDLARLVG
jgi:hypothetical protein